MNKSVLLGSVVAFGLTAFATGASAQATSTPQMGATIASANEVFILQGGKGGSGYGSNRADIDQTGNGNKIGKLSTNVDLSASNLSSQSFDGITSTAYTVLQSGDTNRLTVNQSGSNNEILSRANNIFAVTYSPDGRDTGGSFQSGNNNNVTANQAGMRGQIQFQQIGNDNKAFFDVKSGAKDTYAGIFQFGGDNNTGTINQYGNASNAYAAIVQAGSTNIGTIEQNAITNYAAIIQVGDNNQSYIGQGVNSVGAFTYQNGNGNQATINQNSTSANAAVAQYGTNNYAKVNQH